GFCDLVPEDLLQIIQTAVAMVGEPLESAAVVHAHDVAGEGVLHLQLLGSHGDGLAGEADERAAVLVSPSPRPELQAALRLTAPGAESPLLLALPPTPRLGSPRHRLPSGWQGGRSSS